jgi:polyisoprenoid-binding protein YceI
VWRGKFKQNSGKVVLDQAARAGEPDIAVGVNSIDFGLDAVNEKARSGDFFDTAKYPPQRTWASRWR